jgi:hypothetical protein
VYVPGINGSINRHFRVEYPATWHFYGFENVKVFNILELVRIFRPHGKAAICPTQCDLEPHNDLSAIRFEDSDLDDDTYQSTYKVWPEMGRWDCPYFSAAVTSKRGLSSSIKFSVGIRTRSQRSVGIMVSLDDFIDPFQNLAPPCHTHGLSRW